MLRAITSRRRRGVAAVSPAGGVSAFAHNAPLDSSDDESITAAAQNPGMVTAAVQRAIQARQGAIDEPVSPATGGIAANINAPVNADADASSDNESISAAARNPAAAAAARQRVLDRADRRRNIVL